MEKKWQGLYEAAIQVLKNNEKKTAPEEAQQVGQGENTEKEYQEARTAASGVGEAWSAWL